MGSLRSLEIDFNLPPMFRHRTGKVRLLYLLALIQLVGGPLVLLQVTVFCNLTLNEAPRLGMAKAAVHAWHSPDFQAVLVMPDIEKGNARDGKSRNQGPKVKLGKVKEPVVPWMAPAMNFVALAARLKIVDAGRVWTPAWPQAPPGPPPRVG